MIEHFLFCCLPIIIRSIRCFSCWELWMSKQKIKWWMVFSPSTLSITHFTESQLFIIFWATPVPEIQFSYIFYNRNNSHKNYIFLLLLFVPQTEYISVRISVGIIKEFRATVICFWIKMAAIHLLLSIRYVYIHCTCTMYTYMHIAHVFQTHTTAFYICYMLNLCLPFMGSRCKRPYFCCVKLYMKRARFLEMHSHWWNTKQNKK